MRLLLEEHFDRGRELREFPHCSLHSSLVLYRTLAGRVQELNYRSISMNRGARACAGMHDYCVRRVRRDFEKYVATHVPCTMRPFQYDAEQLAA
jgi:hypothetical protein